MRISDKFSLHLVLIVWLMTGSLAAQNPNLGSAGAQFLKISIGARSAALGGAVTGMSEDATALFWNPAGIAQNHNQSVHFSYIPWMQYFDITAFSYTLKLKDKGTLGFHALTVGMEKMQITTEKQPEGTGQYFDAQDLEMGLSYARQLTDRFSMGFSAKLLHQRIWNETANGLAFDVGTHYSINFQNLVLAMSMKNFGSDLKMEGPELLTVVDENDQFPNRLIQTMKQTEAYPLPLSFQFGVAADLLNTAFLHSRLAIDAVHLNDNAERINIGLESTFARQFIIRGGYSLNDDEAKGSLGLGLNQKLGEMIVKLDYAFVMHERLEDTRFMSLSLIF